MNVAEFNAEITFHTGNPQHGIVGFSIESLLACCKDRLEWHNSTAFKCEENAVAIAKISEALEVLQSRTQRRIDEGKFGTLIP